LEEVLGTCLGARAKFPAITSLPRFPSQNGILTILSPTYFTSLLYVTSPRFGGLWQIPRDNHTRYEKL
jgi:hypothetical protein